MKTSITSHDPRTGTSLAEVAPTPEDQVAAAVEHATAAAAWAAECAPADLAAVLDAIAVAIDDMADEVVATADRETALGTTRLEGELARTTGQLRFLGEVIRDGDHLDVVLDLHHDLRRQRVPIGPVAVFAASNFPLAFSVAGGDTAAALAAGSPVVVKAHPLHPLTSDLVADAVHQGVAAADAPSGLLAVVHGLDAGRHLVQHPGIRAVAFTGSLAGGRAVEALARERAVPVPVHAEMGAINPVVLTQDALAARLDEILDGHVGSFTLGAGQFCTKPGVVFVPADHLPAVRQGLRDRLADRDPVALLGPAIRDGWQQRTTAWADLPGVEVVHRGSVDGADGFAATVALLATDVATWLQTADLREECFGPTSVLVAYDGADDLTAALTVLPGSLTGSVHGGGPHDPLAPLAHRLLRDRVGRLVHDGWPTGVAVSHGMHHGGPWPASTDARFTSVGSAAIGRFLRPVCHQGVPEHLLPPALQDANPWGVPQGRV